MSGAHVDPVVPELLGLSIILVAAKLGAVFAERFKQPEVLGELLAGIIVGNLVLFNFDSFSFLMHDHFIEIFASLGVIILLFEVGLESKVHEMMAVGLKSFTVAIAGVVTPFLVGYYVSGMILPDLPEISKIFMGAILTATSVGITARVFKDLKFTQEAEARIVLGAAVIDDILGLIILAVVSGMAACSGVADCSDVSASQITIISAKAIGFVVAAVVLGQMLAHKTIKLISFFKIPGMMLTTALVACFMGSYLANQMGLAPIVGAFAIGLVLEDVHFKSFMSKISIEEAIQPISILMVPVFFVMTGMQVDLSVFADPSIITAALAVTVAAILGKLVCSWAFWSAAPMKRWIIGVGMIPRGEVGLIFASVGKSIGVIDDRLYAITVIMVILTTLLPPPILSSLIKSSRKGLVNL